MNKIGQFGLILGILFIGVFLHSRFNLSIPASILGMIILFILMLFKVVKLKWVEDIGNMLLDNLSLLLIPGGVGIMKEFHIFKGNMIKLMIILLISTAVVITVTGYTVQILETNKRGEKL